MKLWISLAAVLVASLNAHAGEVTGHTTLTLWFDQGGFATIDLRQEDGRVLGTSDLSSDGLVRLEKSGNTWKGYAEGGFVDLTCADNRCKGMIASSSADATFKTEGAAQIMKGVLNHVAISSKLTSDKLEIYGDGSLELTRQRDGSWEGSGFLTRDIDSRFTARLEADGTLRGGEDLGFFLIQLVAPFVHRGL